MIIFGMKTNTKLNKIQKVSKEAFFLFSFKQENSTFQVHNT